VGSNHAGDPADDDEDVVSENIDLIIRTMGIVTPDHMSKATRDLYMRAHNAQCMTCGKELGDTTTLVVSEIGVLMLFCGGACLQDMQVKGWLEEEYDEIVQKIEMRARVDADSAPIEDEDD